jgi:NADPH:quinone reductase-like Zn-dependent oxidoreductase
MKAIVLQEYGGVDQLIMQGVPDPILGNGEVLIAIKAFGINRAEILMRKGLWGDVASVIGIECVGTIVDDPSGKFKAGQTVAAIMGGMGRIINGSYAEFTCIRSENVFALNTDIDWSHLAAIPESYATAWSCLHNNMKLKSGVTVLIRGGTSALALAAINIASNIDDVTVYETTRNPNNKEILLNAGATKVVIENDELSTHIREMEPQGINSVLDLIGNSTLLDSLKMVKNSGYVCNAGFLGEGPAFIFNPIENLPVGVNLNFFGSFLLGTENFPLSEIPMQKIIDSATNGTYNVKPAKVFEFNDIALAHQLMEDNNAGGKIVITV